MFRNHIIFHIFDIVAAPLPSLSVTICLVYAFMKPLLPKSTICSDWSAEPVCHDWSTTSSMFQKCHAPYHNNEFQHTINVTQPYACNFAYASLGGNYLNEENCDVLVPGKK